MGSFDLNITHNSVVVRHSAQYAFNDSVGVWKRTHARFRTTEDVIHTRMVGRGGLEWMPFCSIEAGKIIQQPFHNVPSCGRSPALFPSRFQTVQILLEGIVSAIQCVEVPHKDGVADADFLIQNLNLPEPVMFSPDLQMSGNQLDCG